MSFSKTFLVSLKENPSVIEEVIPEDVEEPWATIRVPNNTNVKSFLYANEAYLDLPAISQVARETMQGEVERFYDMMFDHAGVQIPERITEFLIYGTNLIRFFNLLDREAIGTSFSINYERPHHLSTETFDYQVLEELLTGREITKLHTLPLTMNDFLVFKEGVIQGVYGITDCGNTQQIRFVGSKALAEKLKSILLRYDDKDQDIYVERLCADGNGCIYTRTKAIKKRNPVLNPKTFWPFAAKTPQEMAAEFEASNSNVLILYGSPGLGKSQYIAEMIKWKKENSAGSVYVCDDKPVFQSIHFTPHVHSLSNGSWLVTEDAREMIEAREVGNSMMAGILNAAEGITSGNVKFIISTNITSLKDVDEALYRPGRTLRVIPFKSLSQEQANAAREAIGFTAIDFGSVNKLSLAEALNWESYQALQSEIKQGGFIGN